MSRTHHARPPHRALAPATRLVDVLEKDWDRDLFIGRSALAVMLGWTSYHTLRSKGSKSGYPDRTLVRDRVVFVELKREKTGPTDDQVEWLDRLAAAGGEVYLWRPSDLDEISRVLATRWTYLRGSLGREESCSFVDVWTPASLWIPGIGRADTTHHDEQQTLLAKGAA